MIDSVVPQRICTRVNKITELTKSDLDQCVCVCWELGGETGPVAGVRWEWPAALVIQNGLVQKGTSQVDPEYHD